MRRVCLSVFVGALVAVPLGLLTGIASGDESQGSGTVAASECPGAADAYVEAGYPRPDTFTPGCPDLGALEPYEPGISDEELAQDCEVYAEKPAWCPEASESETGGAR